MHFSAAIFAFSVACLLALGSTPVARRLALSAPLRRLRATPDARKIHVASRPQAGGLALYFSLITTLALTLLSFVGVDVALRPLLLGLLPATLVVVGVGFYDDLRGCGPVPKILAQLLALVLLQAQFDVLGLGGANATAWPALALIAVVPWLLGLTNAMNLIDGLDGLASGVAVISGLGLAVLAFALGDGTSAILATALVGAALGFLRSNAHPAKIFLGDSGSMLLGFVLATVGLRLLALHPEPSLLLALVLISWVPCLDAVFAVVRRSLRGVSIFQPDQGHVHHRLLRAGFSAKLAGAALWGLSLLSAAAGIMVALERHGATWAIAVIVATLPLAWLLRPAASRRGALSSPAATTPTSRRVVSQDRAA